MSKFSLFHGINGNRYLNLDHIESAYIQSTYEEYKEENYKWQVCCYVPGEGSGTYRSKVYSTEEEAKLALDEFLEGGGER